MRKNKSTVLCLTEKEVYHNYLLSLSALVDLYPIETGRVTNGIPDIYFSSVISAKNGWIELKIGKKESNGKISVIYRPGQQNFIRRHFLKGHIIFTLIYLEGTFYATNCYNAVYQSREELEIRSFFVGKDLMDKKFIRIFM